MSSFEEEWAQLKQEAAVPTQLASAEGTEGEGKSDLTASHESWSKLSAATSSLSYATQGTVTQLANGQRGLAASTVGFASATAQRGLRTCWGQRLEAITDECQQIASAMLMARNTYEAGERDITSSFDASRDR